MARMGKTNDKIAGSEESGDDLREKMVAINRVTKVVKGGRILGFAALTVVGDGDGSVGMGKGKSREVPIAVQKAMDEARKKMATLGTEMERDAFLQKTFGAENISTGRILLANTALFEEYTKGVTGTNVATEQAAINSDTMATVVKELGAAWDNMIIGVADGNGALDAVKDVLRFVAENLGTIVTWVGKAVVAWGAYRATLLLWNSTGTGVIQTLGKMFSAMQAGTGTVQKLGGAIKSLGVAGLVGALTILLPMLWDAGKAIFQLFNHTDALNRVTEKLNSEMDKEKAKMSLLYQEIIKNNAGSAEREDIIKRINDTYGTTLTNLSSEVDFMRELEAAYNGVVAAMERKLKAQIVEEELLALYKEQRELQRALEKGIGSGDVALNLLAGGVGSARLNDVTQEIANLNKELFSLNQTSAETGKTLGAIGVIDRGANATTPLGDEDPDKKKKELDELAELRKKNSDELIAKENELIRAGYDSELIGMMLRDERLAQYKEELALIKDLKYSEEERNKTENDRLQLLLSNQYRVPRVEEEDREKQEQENFDLFVDNYEKQKDLKEKQDEEDKKREEEALDRRKKFTEDSINLIKKITDAMATEIDRRIALEQNELAASKDKIDYLQEQANLGNTDAAESIKAETIAMAKQSLEIERLEKKKRNLLVVVTGLELASQNIGKGDPNAVQNAGTAIADFIAKLPKFYEGTEGTVAEALGRPHLPGKDGYLTRVDGKEMIFKGSTVDSLRAAGLQTTSDVAQAALANSGRIMRQSVSGSGSAVAEIVQMKNEIVGAIQNIPETEIRYDEINRMLTETKTYNGKIINNHFKIRGGLFS